MKRLLYIPLLVSLLLACKEDSMDVMSFADLHSFNGIWRLSEVERASIDNNNSWEAAPAALIDTLIFRSDGVLLNPDGTARCCAPKSLLINGQLLDIKPLTPIPANPVCALVSCVYCPTWEISWTDDVMIITPCSGSRLKYIR